MVGKLADAKQLRREREHQRHHPCAYASSLVRVALAGNGGKNPRTKDKCKLSHHIIIDTRKTGSQKCLELIFVLMVEEARHLGNQASADA